MNDDKKEKEKEWWEGLGFYFCRRTKKNPSLFLFNVLLEAFKKKNKNMGAVLTY